MKTVKDIKHVISTSNLSDEAKEMVLASVAVYEHFSETVNDALDGDLNAREGLINLYREHICNAPLNASELSRSQIGDIETDLYSFFDSKISEFGEF